jgi:methyl-accepting chemotaxis protein
LGNIPIDQGKGAGELKTFRRLFIWLLLSREAKITWMVTTKLPSRNRGGHSTMLFSPVIHLMNQLKISQKVLLLIVIMTIPLAMMSYYLVAETRENIDFSAKERLGMKCMPPAYGLLDSVIKLREAGSGKADIAAFEGTVNGVGQGLLSKDASDALKKAAATLGGAADPVGDATVAAIADLADNSNLTLDPDVDSYYLMDVLTTRLPAIMDTTSRAAALARKVVAAKALSGDDRTQIIVYLSQISALRDAISGDVAKVYKATPAIKERIDGAVQSVVSPSTQFEEKINKTLLAQPAVFNDSLLEPGMAVVRHGMTAYATVGTELDSLLAARIHKYSSRMTIRLVIVGVLFLAALWMAAGFYQTTRRAVVAIQAGIGAVAAGDLTTEIEVTAKDDFGDISRSLSNMSSDLRNMVDAIAASAGHVASASTQLHATAHQVTDISTDIAERVTTMATASEEMSATSTDISRSCHSASEDARHSGVEAQEGVEVFNTAITGMVAISKRVKQAATSISNLGAKSEQIGQIIGTIEDIADQTNLLALNAAIEAARAGEQGRGFAVVADEVRALAERTTRATKEIGDMIKAIQTETSAAVTAMETGVRETENGGESVKKAERSLDTILEKVAAVSMQIAQIATASEEQAATSGEISGSICQITSAAGQMARSSEETTATAAQLSQESQNLRGLVDRFVI